MTFEEFQEYWEQERTRVTKGLDKFAAMRAEGALADNIAMMCQSGMIEVDEPENTWSCSETSWEHYESPKDDIDLADKGQEVHALSASLTESCTLTPGSPDMIQGAVEIPQGDFLRTLSPITRRGRNK